VYKGFNAMKWKTKQASLNLRLYESEKKKWSDASEKEGKSSLAEFVRCIVNDHIDKSSIDQQKEINNDHRNWK